MKAPAKSVPPEIGVEPDVAAVDASAACSPDPAVALDRQRRAGRAERAQARQVAAPHRLDAGLQAARVERRAGAEEGDAGRGGEAPQRRPVGRAPARRFGRPGCRRRGRSWCRRAAPPIWQFHMIQPVELYQWKRSPVVGARAEVVVQRADLQRLEHDAAVAVDDRLRQAGRAARIDDPERVVERQPGRRERAGRRRRSASKSCAARAGRGERGASAPASRSRQQRRRRARSAARRRSSRSTRACGRGRRRRSGSRRRRSAPSARSGGSGRAPPAGPCRASTPTRPRRGWRRRGRRPPSAACSAGRRATRSPGATPIAASAAASDADLAAQLGPGDLARSPRACIASSRKTIAGWPAACAASAWRNTLLRVVHLRAGEPARAGHRLVDQHARVRRRRLRCRSSPRSTARTRAGRRTTSARGAS